MLLGTLGASLLGNLVSGKGILRAGSRNKKRKSNCQSWLWKQNGFLMPSNPLTNFEIKRYYQNEPIFNSVYSRNNLFKKIKDGANVINLDEHAEISQRKLCSKKLRKYVSAFDYIDKILIVHSATIGWVCVVSYATVVGAPVGIACTGFTIVFSLATGIIKELLSATTNKKKKHNKILLSAKSKLNITETLVSQALIDMEISHEEFISILKGKDKYEKMKEIVRNVSEKLEEKKAENMRLNSVNSRSHKK